MCLYAELDNLHEEKEEELVTTINTIIPHYIVDFNSIDSINKLIDNYYIHNCR